MLLLCTGGMGDPLPLKAKPLLCAVPPPNCVSSRGRLFTPLDGLLLSPGRSCCAAQDAILALDAVRLDPDQVDGLLKFCPTKEEAEMIKGYAETGDKEMLGKCEQFFLEMCRAPRMENKLKVFAYRIAYDQQIEDVGKKLAIVNSACKEVRGATASCTAGGRKAALAGVTVSLSSLVCHRCAYRLAAHPSDRFDDAHRPACAL